MADYKKVLKGLECLSDENNICSKNTCLYYMFESCVPEISHDALELLKKQPQWISVEDRMPPELHSMWFPLYGTSKWKNVMWREESDHVLVTVVFDDGTRYVSMGRTHDGEWNTNISKVVHHTVTHWMPLPEPPEEVNQDGEV